MTVTIGGVVLPIPQMESVEYPVLINEARLYPSGKISIQASTEYGKGYQFQCVGTSTQITDLLGKVGTAGTLVINGSSYSNFFIKSFGPVTKNTMTNYYSFHISLVQDTSL